MKKIILLSLLLGLSSFSAIVAGVECPATETIVATGVEEDSDKVSSMVYCSPSEQSCEWKGFDPMAEKGSAVRKVLNPNNTATEHKGLTYCDYELETGDQIRMSLAK